MQTDRSEQAAVRPLRMHAMRMRIRGGLTVLLCQVVGALNYVHSSSCMDLVTSAGGASWPQLPGRPQTSTTNVYPSS